MLPRERESDTDPDSWIAKITWSGKGRWPIFNWMLIQYYILIDKLIEWCLSLILATPFQRATDGPESNAHGVDDDGEVARDEDDGVDVRSDHLSSRWLWEHEFPNYPPIENTLSEIFQNNPFTRVLIVFLLVFHKANPYYQSKLNLQYWWNVAVQLVLELFWNVFLNRIQMSRMARRTIWLAVNISMLTISLAVRKKFSHCI